MRMRKKGFMGQLGTIVIYTNEGNESEGISPS
jgi:hypothetical protein